MKRRIIMVLLIVMMIFISGNISFIQAERAKKLTANSPVENGCYSDSNSKIFNSDSSTNINFKLIGAATFIITIGELKIACDPSLCPKGTVFDYGLFKSERMEEPVYEDEDFENIDLWLITHNHDDHLDEIGLSKISSETTIITHKNTFETLEKTNSKNISILRWYQNKKLDIDGFEINIQAIPAIHAVNPIVAISNGGVNGYWVDIKNNSNDESFSMYITGDTVTKWIVLSSLRGRKVDLFIPFMGCARVGNGFLGLLLGPLTLNAKMMKKMKNIIDPEVTVPVHFGTFSHYTEPISEVEKWNDNSIKILNPGENIVLDL